jgi:hypothetical protein
MLQYYQKETAMNKQSKKAITITPERKAPEEDLAAIKQPPEGEPYVQTVVGITQLPELGGKARAWFPTHDFEVTKKHREYLFHTSILEEFLNERRIKILGTTSKDLEDLRRSWLNDEIREIEKLIEKPHISRSDRHELNKYRDYVQSELKAKAGVINTEPDNTKMITPVDHKDEVKKETNRLAPYLFYGFYQYVNELFLVPQIRMPKYPDGHWAKEKISKIAEEYYHVEKGVNFYNAFNYWTGVRLPNGVRLMKPKQRRKLKDNTFKIAKSLNDYDYIDWWNDAFPEK